jgi:hypothetical protein
VAALVGLVLVERAGGGPAPSWNSTRRVPELAATAVRAAPIHAQQVTPRWRSLAVGAPVVPALVLFTIGLVALDRDRARSHRVLGAAPARAPPTVA